VTSDSSGPGYTVNTSTLRQSAEMIQNQCINTDLSNMQQALNEQCLIPGDTFALVNLFSGVGDLGLGDSAATSTYNKVLNTTQAFVSTLSQTFASYVTRLNTTAKDYDQADASSAQAAAHAVPTDPGYY
jgi:hypothetical protein